MEKYHVHMSVKDFRTVVEADSPDQAVIRAIQKCEQTGDTGETMEVKEVRAE